MWAVPRTQDTLATEVLLLLTHVNGTVSHRRYERRASATESSNACWKHFYFTRRGWRFCYL